MLLDCVIVLAIVMVLAHVIVLANVMVLIYIWLADYLTVEILCIFSNKTYHMLDFFNVESKARN